MIFEVLGEDQNIRLDRFLVSKLEIYSRSQIQKLIKDGFILVNNKKTTPHCFLKVGDKVTIDRQQSTDNNQQTTIDSNKSNHFNNINIIKEQSDYLVLEKPAGLLVHPDQVHQEPTLIDWLLKHKPLIAKVGDNPLRPGIVHRLDREVSGLMVIAKTQEMFEHLKSQFKQRKIRKEYLVLVHGAVLRDEFEVNLPIGRSKSGYFVAQTNGQKEAKTASTEFEVVRRFKTNTLLKAVLKTGRTHQIRVHLKSQGHSIVGDKLYQTRDLKNKKNSFLMRPFLHSHILGFFDLENNWQEFKSDLSQDLNNFLRELK